VKLVYLIFSYYTREIDTNLVLYPIYFWKDKNVNLLIKARF